MSFKVGDYLVMSQIDDFNGVYKFHSKPFRILILEHESGFYGRLPIQVRHATQEEIAAGHRIDHSEHDNEMIELSGNSEELEVLEMIDVSPNCKVSEL